MASAQLPHYAVLASFSFLVSTDSIRYFSLVDEHSAGLRNKPFLAGLLLVGVLS
jgi:hypothetical protein